MKILITAASDASAYRLKSELNKEAIVLGDFKELPELMVRTGNMIILPDPAHPAYAHKMLALCLDREISSIYTLRREEYDQLQEARLLFEEYGIQIINATHEI